MSTWYVTFSALRRYASEARQAQSQLDEARDQMKNAAKELCSKWKGDASVAFADEQGVLENWFTQLTDIVTEYISLVETTVQKYEEKENELANQVNG